MGTITPALTAEVRLPDLARKMLRYRWVCYGMLLLTYVFVYFDRVAPAVVAPELMKEFGLSATGLGILSSMYFYPYAAMQIPSGILSDYLGPRISTSSFFIIAAIGTALFGLATTFGWCIFGRFLMGVGVAVVWVPCMRILANWFRPSENASLTGMMLTWGNIGAILASAPLAWLCGLVGWRQAFFWLGGAMAILAVADFILLRNKPQDMGFPTVSQIDGVDHWAGAEGEGAPFKENLKRLFKMKNYWLLSMFLGLVYGTIMGFQGLWFIPFAQDVYSLPKQTAANMLMMWPIGFAIGATVIGYFSDRIFKSRRKTSLYFCVVYVITWIPMAFFPGDMSPNWLYAVLFVMGLVCGNYIPNYAHITEGQPHSFYATANGMMNIWCFVGGAAFQAIMGVMLDAYGRGADGKFPVNAYQATFVMCLVCLVVATVLMYFTEDKSHIATKKA
ncbi:MAG: MFS transporter [Syntrophobacteraceae bacterium]